MGIPISLSLRHYFILLLVVCGVYWWLWVYAVPYDMLDCWLPWRHFIAKSFNQGIFPLWNPYQQLGYPVYADLQGPLYSPENFVTANLFTFNLSALQVILFGYLCLAAIGMYELGRYLFQHRHTALIIAGAYVCGQVFTDHAQHFFSIVSFACIPLTLLALLKFLENQQWKYLLLLFLMLHLQFTTGNQTMNILNAHFMGFFFIRQLYLSQKNLKRLLIRSCCLGILLIISLSPLWLAYFQHTHQVSRYTGLEFERSILSPMTWQASLSFINPAIIMQTDLVQTDPSMAGYNFGWTLLFCSIGYFVASKSKWRWYLLGTLVFIFIMSLGNATPLFGFMYTIDPLLRMFRCPAYYMFYVWMILLIASGYFLREIIEEKISWKIIYYSLLGLTMTMGVTAFAMGFDMNWITSDNPFVAFKTLSLAQSFSFYFILGIMLSVLWSVFLFLKTFRQRTFVLIMLTEVVLLGNSSSFLSGTARKVQDTDQFIASLPKNFGLPSQRLNTNADLMQHLPDGIWQNYHTYFNLVSPDFFNSFYLDAFYNYATTEEEIKKLYDLPLISATNPDLLQFTPNYICFTTKHEAKQSIMVSQCNSPQWKLYVDGQPHKINPSPLVSFNLREGLHRIELKFENPWAIRLFWLSLIVFVFALVLFIFLHYGKVMAVMLSGASITLFVTATAKFFFSGAETDAIEKPSNASYTLINKPLFNQVNRNHTFDARLETEELVSAIINSKQKQLIYIDSGNFNPPIIESVIYSSYQFVRKNKQGNVTTYSCRDRNDQSTRISLVQDDFNISPKWDVPGGVIQQEENSPHPVFALNTTLVYGPGIRLKENLRGKYLFGLNAVFLPDTTQHLNAVLEIKSGDTQLFYEAKLMQANKELVLFKPPVNFTGNEIALFYYWYTGKSEVKLYRPELVIIRLGKNKE